MQPLVACATDGRLVAPTADERPVPWWSFGKTVLAAAALALVAEGRLALDEPLAGSAYTPRALLGHRAGLGCYGMLRAYHEAVARRETPWTRAEMLDRVERLHAEPGRRFTYSNVGYALLRGLIETTTGLPLADALDRLVLAPLGISGVTVAHATADLAATPWGDAGGYHPGWVYHGLLLGTVGDAALLLDRLLGGDLLAPNLLAAMRTARPVGEPQPGRPWPKPGYGLGLMCGIGEPAIRVEGHTGGGPGSRIAVYHAPSTGITACAAAATEDEGAVERCALALAAGQSARIAEAAWLGPHSARGNA